MPDTNADTKYKVLLKAAEEKIVELSQDNESLRGDLDSVLEAQKLETAQMVEMSEQMWKLEEALMSTTGEKDAALMMLQSMKVNLDRIKSCAEGTLTALKQNKASRLAMAVQVYEIKSMVETLKLDKK